MAPGVSGKTIPWILHKWDINARLRDDPMELYNMLHYDAGLRPNIATSIVKDVFSVEEEFADLLYQRGEQPIFFRPPGYGYGAQPTFVGWGQPAPATAPIGWGYGQPPPAPGAPSKPATPTPAPPVYLFPPPTGAPSWTGWQPSAGPYLTREEYIKMQREQEEKSRLAKLEERMGKMDTEQKERMSKLDKDLAGALTSLKEEIFERIGETLKPKEDKVVLPLLDEKGAPVVDEKGVARTVEVPTHMAPYIMTGMRRGLTEDDIRRIVQEEGKPREEKVVLPLVDEKGTLVRDEKTGEVKTITVPSNMTPFIMTGMRRGLTEDDIRKIVREEAKPPEETPTVKELKSRLDKAEERYDELKETMEAEDRKRIEDTIKGLQGEIKTLRSRPAGQYSEDTFRLLDSTLNRLADILEGRKPSETLKDILLPQGVTGARPPSEKASETERGGVLEQLRKEGLVVRVVERLRR